VAFAAVLAALTAPSAPPAAASFAVLPKLLLPVVLARRLLLLLTLQLWLLAFGLDRPRLRLVLAFAVGTLVTFRSCWPLRPLGSFTAILSFRPRPALLLAGLWPLLISALGPP
jgi:hypothetical protein